MEDPIVLRKETQGQARSTWSDLAQCLQRHRWQILWSQRPAGLKEVLNFWFSFQAMESEVNVCYKELCGPRPSHQLLTNQLQRLCVLLDVYLETESHDDSVEGPKEFPQEKMCLRLFRYRVCVNVGFRSLLFWGLDSSG